MQIYSLKEMGIFVRNGIEHNNNVIYTFNGLWTEIFWEKWIEHFLAL